MSAPESWPENFRRRVEEAKRGRRPVMVLGGRFEILTRREFQTVEQDRARHPPLAVGIKTAEIKRNPTAMDFQQAELVSPVATVESKS